MPAKRIRVVRVCAQCGDVFERTPSQLAQIRGLYCSNACRSAAGRRRITLICRFCESPFERIPSRAAEATYCSQACKSAIRGPQQKTCEQCGKLFLVDQCRIDKGEGRFCGSRCFGDSMIGVSPCKNSPEERFWSRVNKDGPIRSHCPEIGPCWLWTGPTDRKGYGRTHLGERSNQGAHQTAWIFTRGAITNGLWVLHRCDNPPCVNPNHLFLGTSNDNVQDAVEKGRNVKGSRHPLAKIEEADVISIRQLGAAGMSHRQIGLKYGISPSAAGFIIKRKRWKHVP